MHHGRHPSIVTSVRGCGKWRQYGGIVTIFIGQSMESVSCSWLVIIIIGLMVNLFCTNSEDGDLPQQVKLLRIEFMGLFCSWHNSFLFKCLAVLASSGSGTEDGKVFSRYSCTFFKANKQTCFTTRTVICHFLFLSFRRGKRCFVLMWHLVLLIMAHCKMDFDFKKKLLYALCQSSTIS